jgi:nucleotide-binding universal stress UspA family protein
MHANGDQTMTAIHAETATARRQPSRASSHDVKPGEQPRRILAAVDGSESTNAVTDYLVALADGGAAMEVVVLNVQAQPENWRLRGYGSFKQDEIRDRLINDLGRPIVRGVGRKLSKAGISHRERVEIGIPAEAIIRCAEEEHCDLVIVGDPRPGVFGRWLARAAGISFGSVAASVVQLAGTSVVVVK